MSRTQSPRKHLAVHARKLALEPDLQILRRHRRSLLRRLEQAHRSALADHVHRNARMGPPVLISESWYKPIATAHEADRGVEWNIQWQRNVGRNKIGIAQHHDRFGWARQRL